MIYLLVFTASVLLMLVAIRFKENKIIFYGFSILSIISVCFLASARSLDIGKDVRVYVEPLFSGVDKYNGLFDFFGHLYNIKDYGYAFTTFLCRIISKDIGVLFFVNQLLITVPIYIALIKKLGKSKKSVLGWLLFLLLMYNQTLNMVRQSIAISFCVLAIALFDDRKIYKFFIPVVIAFLFHKSAAIIVGFYLLYKIFNTNKISDKSKMIIKSLLIAFIICTIFNLQGILAFFNRIGIISDSKYILYGVKYLRNGFDFPIVRTGMYIMSYLVIALNKKNFVDKKLYDWLCFCGILAICLLQFAATIKFSERISYYLYYPLVLLFIPAILSKIPKHKYLYGGIFLEIHIIYWIYWVILVNYDSTNPFMIR